LRAGEQEAITDSETKRSGEEREEREEREDRGEGVVRRTSFLSSEIVPHLLHGPHVAFGDLACDSVPTFRTFRTFRTFLTFLTFRTFPTFPTFPRSHVLPFPT
jgi:hypothetical protein